MPRVGKTFDEIASDDPSSARHRMLVILRDVGPLSRADVARRTGLAPATITSLSRELLGESALLEVGPLAGLEPRTGPRGTGLAINPRLAHALGVDIGFRTLRVMVSDAFGQEVGYAEERLGPDHTAVDGLPLLTRLTADALRAAVCSQRDLVAAGVAVRSPVDTDRQQVSTSGEMAGWSGTSAADVGAALGCPAILGNDANLAALGEHVYGAGRGYGTSLTVKLHSGVGAGVIVHDRLVTGLHGGAGEVGHVQVEPRGSVCRCGKTGCLDTRASISAIVAALGGDVSVAEILDRVAAGDRPSVRVVRDAARLVGRTVANASLLLAPESIVVVGALARAGAVVLDPIREAVTAGAVPGTHTAPAVTLGELGDRPTVLGGLALALDRCGWRARGPRRHSSEAAS
jgi:predicted NBD/HSP70 family sugar kinase